MRSKLAACAFAISILPLALAAGAGIESKTSLNLGPKPGKFTGVVTSDDPACVAGRKILIKRVVPGPNEKVAKDFSDINGIWQVGTDERSGTWYAKLKRERRFNRVCAGDKSPRRSAG